MPRYKYLIAVLLALALQSWRPLPTIGATPSNLYGIKDALWTTNRRVRVRIQVLAPSVQITENLGDFWRDTYPKLKHQLQRRYPKHEWR